MPTTLFRSQPRSFQFIAIWTVAGFISLAAGCNSEPNELLEPNVPDQATTGKPASSQTDSVVGDVAPSREPLDLETLPDGEGEVEGTFSVSQIMELAHENKLYRELFVDDFDPAAGERLVLLYSSLPQQSSPKSDAEDWTKRATALLDAAKSVVAGEQGSVAAYKRAVNCNSCHSRHKP